MSPPTRQPAPERQEGAPAGLVPVACPLCGSERRAPRFVKPPFSIVTCTDCDLTYVTPRFSPEALLSEVYGADYWRSPAPRDRGYGDYEGDAPLYRRTFALRKRRILDPHFAAPGRVLDVGCAAGFFLEVMAQAGWDVQGIEPSPAMRAIAAEALGPGRLHPGTLEQAPFAPASFDLITFWDVLEHLPDPVGVLARARALLSPGGLILIETQNIQSRAARLLGSRWQHFKHAEHLVHFHPGTLARTLEAAGLRQRTLSARFGGKFVSPAFIAERAGKVHPLLALLLSPLRLIGGFGIYVNPFDELIALAAPAREP